MSKDENSAKNGMSRREAIQIGTGSLLGAATMMAGGGELARLAAQNPGVDVMPTPLPAADPRFPMPPSWSRELRMLAPNVYAYVQAGGPGIPSGGVSNMGMIAGPDFLWGIDGSLGPIPAKAFVAAARQATGKRFGRLLLTHHHGDHTGGLQFFDGAEVWSHPYCRDEVLKAVAATPKTWIPAPNGVADVAEPRKLVVPILTFKDDVSVMVGDTEVQFKFAGTSHTWGDMMAYLPKQKILFAGDVDFFHVAPYANNSYISKWLETCDSIAGWDVDIIVPGHGPIGGKKELALMADYFHVLGVEARKRYDRKMSPGAAAAEIRLGQFDNWLGPERLIMDTVRWYAEWDGTLHPTTTPRRFAGPLSSTTKSRPAKINRLRSSRSAEWKPWRTAADLSLLARCLPLRVEGGDAHAIGFGVGPDENDAVSAAGDAGKTSRSSRTANAD
jgi:glyoxylase-like metal-dependent hydrolase (beta-lactamase superfamily II)